jgi:hypothetical protein
MRDRGDMESTPAGAREAVEPELDGELRLLREAIMMVATGVSPHVTVAGLRFGDRLVPACVSMAREAGVRVLPVRSSGGRIGFSVEREPPPSSQPSTLVAGRPLPVHP